MTFCYARFKMPSTVKADPVCVKSMETIMADEDNDLHIHDNISSLAFKGTQSVEYAKFSKSGRYVSTIE